MPTLVLGCLLSGFVIAFIATSLLRRLAPKWGLIDTPAARKVHVTPTPMGGGIGIWCGTVLPLLGVTLLAVVLRDPSSVPDWIPDPLRRHFPGLIDRAGELWILIGGATALAVVGLIDDFKDLGWKFRLGVQFSCALLFVYGAGVQATVFADQPWVGQAVTVLWIMALVNAFNFLDNMDGLTGGIGLVASLMFATVMLTATGEPRWFVAGVLLLLAGSLIGFLCHNWSPAAIFMGDSGSYFIGAMLSCLAVRGTFYDETVPGRHVMLTPLFILAIPLYDLTTVILIRLKEGRSPFHPDKSHFSHRLVELGLKKSNAVLTIHLATLTTGLAALLLYAVPDWPSAGVVGAIILCVLAMVTILETAGRRKHRRAAQEPSQPPNRP